MLLVGAFVSGIVVFSVVTKTFGISAPFTSALFTISDPFFSVGTKILSKEKYPTSPKDYVYR